MTINTQVISAANKGFDFAEQAIAQSRHAFNTACDPNWQQVQAARAKLIITLLISCFLVVRSQIDSKLAQAKVAKSETEAIFWAAKQKIRHWHKKGKPYAVKAIEGVGIALFWLTDREEFVYSIVLPVFGKFAQRSTRALASSRRVAELPTSVYPKFVSSFRA